MAENIIQCPQCQRPLRVTDELRNRMVKCPSCEATFTVPTGSDDPQPVGPPRGESETVPPAGPRPAAPLAGQYGPRPGRGYPEPGDFYPEDRERARNAVLLPAIFLLVTGTLGLLVNLLNLAQLLLLKPEDLLAVMKQFEGLGPPADPATMRTGGIAAGAVLATLSLVVILGAVQMLRLRAYALAIISSLLPMINCTLGCCVLGLPIGIWSLIVLARPEVRAAFK